MDLETGVRLADTQGFIKTRRKILVSVCPTKWVGELGERAIHKPERDLRET